MEDSSQGSRRSHTESSSSRDPIMTPTSSTNSSSAHLPRSNAAARAVSGASLLQERLRERKVESTRQGRRRSVDLSGGGGGEERGVQSSPVKASMAKEERRPSTSGVTAGKGMGVKQIEEQVSTLHKQNFDLKLELYHRRQRQEALETRLEAAEKQIAEQKELQEINEQLLAELEKRDQAVEEAVSIIVNLEDKVERLMREREQVRSFDMQHDSRYSLQSDQQSSSPPTFHEKSAEQMSKAIARMPSFLSEQSDGTDALRSLYLPLSHSYTDTTLPKLPEEVGSDVPDSPRLSVLSESSFLSVYGEKKLSLGPAEDDEADTPQRRHRKSSSVEKWIDERPASTATPLRRADGIRKNGFLSLDDVLESPLQRLEKLKHTLEKHNTSLVTTRLPEPSRVEENRKSREPLHRGFAGKASFEHQNALPPTPDTISTSTLTRYKNSNDTLVQQADPNEKTFLSSISTFPVPNPSYNAFQSTISMRPRSAGETITSRRDGHGWDTETQEDLTETGSLSSTASACSAPRYQQKRVKTPDLFSFNNLENQGDLRDWGRDMMFNNDSAARIPVSKAQRYDALRRSSVVEDPQADGTVGPNKRMIRYNNAQNLQYGVSGIDTSSPPRLPDRRSSLTATIKFRKTNPAATDSSPTSKERPNESKKARLALPRLFTRSETTPSLTTSQQRLKTNVGGRSQSYYEGAENEETRATPPPIKRNRRTEVSSYRPTSAGEDASRSFDYDSAVDEEVKKIKRFSVNLDTPTAETEDPGSASRNGRKWLGFGRTGSMRRT